MSLVLRTKKKVKVQNSVSQICPLEVKETQQLHVTSGSNRVRNGQTHTHFLKRGKMASAVLRLESERTDAVFVPWPFAITVSISWLCLSTIEEYKKANASK